MHVLFASVFTAGVSLRLSTFPNIFYFRQLAWVVFARSASFLQRRRYISRPLFEFSSNPRSDGFCRW
jgi:hypothetical protein